MTNRVTSGWRSKPDPSTRSDAERADDKDGVSMRDNAGKLEAWEDEGGRMGRVSSEIPRVLIVDNDMKAADCLELMLNDEGYVQTRVAYSAHAALALAIEFHPDVAFLEMNLLDMDTNELAQRLRERAQIHDLRLIAITSSRQHAGRDVARNAGFERYLLKPISAAELSKLLDVVPRNEASSKS